MNQETASFIQVIFNILLWLLIFVSFKSSYRAPFLVKKTNRRVGIILILIFCLFPFWGGDYFHYKEILDDFNNGGVLSGQEIVYNWVFRTFGYTYTSLRLFIWGLALFALFWAYKRSCKSVDLTLFFFGLCFLPTFSYARVSLSMSLILLGLSFIVYPGKLNAILSFIVGFVITMSSLLFHKSAPIGIAMAFASIFLIRMSKKKIALIVLIIPVLVVALQKALSLFMVMDLDTESFISDRARSTYFADDSSGTAGIGALIGTVLQQGPSYLMALLYLFVAWSGKIRLFTIPEKAISAYAFCITLLSIGFSFDVGYSLNVLQYRTLFFAFPANAVFLAAVHRNKLKRKLFRFIFYTAVLSTGYQLLYAAYLSLVLF